MKNASVVIALVVGLVLGLVLGRMTVEPGEGGEARRPDQARQAAPAGRADTSPEARQAAATDEPIYKVDVQDGWVKGPDDALVTIVEWSSFQCPFCARVQPTLDQIRRDYGDKVRLVFKHQPLAFQQHSHIAAQAAEAAGAQGKFWEYHAKLFENTRALDRPSLERYAQELGLDMDKFRADLDNETHKAKVDRQQQQAVGLGATGTPAFFINGRFLRGAQPVDAFKRVIDEEIKRAEAVLERGVAKADLYATLVADGQTSVQPDRPAQPEQRRPERPQFGRATVGEYHAKGPADAPVTIVEFSSIQCPFCARVRPTLEQIKREYGDQVRLVFKHQPLPNQRNSGPAAEATEAAGEQGKFWEYLDKVFANQRQLERADLERYAQELGLDMAKFRAALDEGKFRDKVQQSSAEGRRIGASGTPTFFINGRLIAGAQPFAAFKTIIDEEIENAQKLLDAGTARGDLYAKLLDENEKKHGAAAPSPAVRPAGAQQPAADERVEIDVSTAVIKGNPNAPVTIVEFSSFQCPFCGRVQPTLNQLLQEYDGKVRLAFMNRPLPFQANSQLAAEAAMAANDQGKFWEYHAKLFANMRALERPNLERYAEEIGLDMAKFRAALDQGQFKDVVANHDRTAQRVGASGTPTFFINGRRLVGAQPIENFKEIIDAELARAGRN
jgi:protein-disulfide isomerase